MIMGPKFLRCPGCNVALQFKPNTLATMVTCPKCGDSILNCLSILNDDSDRYGIRDDLLKILGEIGTQKSSKVIEDIEFNFILERSAKRTLEQIRKRQLKQ